MILIDTSVWIEYFKQNSEYVTDVQSLLERQAVITIEPVFSELLYGVRNRKEKELIESYWQILPRIDFRSNSMLEAAEFANLNDYYKLGIGIIDAIIVKSTMEGNHLLWTLDGKIQRAVKDQMLYLPDSRI
jgi:predicted nucleic acid-binding protein